MRTVVRWLAGLAACLAAPAAIAAMPPPIVERAVAAAEHACRAAGGQPNTEAMLGVQDLNDDGGEDWSVDFARLRCGGAANPFCGSGGCRLQIYLWGGGSRWELAFDEVVHAVRMEDRGSGRVLVVQYGGSVCGKANSQTCPREYRVSRGSISPIR